MKEFSIPLSNKYERPVIELYKLPALIDTGALIPVISIFPSIIDKYFDTISVDLAATKKARFIPLPNLKSAN